MNAGSEKLLIFRCAELLGTFPFTDKMSQKRDLTENQKLLNPHEKYSKLMQYRNCKVKTWPVVSEMLIGSAGLDKNRWRRKDTR